MAGRVASFFLEAIAGMIARAAVYSRVSDSKGNKGEREARSIEEQADECRADAARLGWKVIEYSDADRSASRFSTAERPGWERLLTDLSAGRLDAIVIWKTSRGDRKLATWAALLDTCRARRVLI